MTHHQRVCVRACKHVKLINKCHFKHFVAAEAVWCLNPLSLFPLVLDGESERRRGGREEEKTRGGWGARGWRWRSAARGGQCEEKETSGHFRQTLRICLQQKLNTPLQITYLAFCILVTFFRCVLLYKCSPWVAKHTLLYCRFFLLWCLTHVVEYLMSGAWRCWRFTSGKSFKTKMIDVR